MKETVTLGKALEDIDLLYDEVRKLFPKVNWGRNEIETPILRAQIDRCRDTIPANAAAFILEGEESLEKFVARTHTALVQQIPGVHSDSRLEHLHASELALATLASIVLVAKLQLGYPYQLLRDEMGENFPPGFVPVNPFGETIN